MSKKILPITLDKVNLSYDETLVFDALTMNFAGQGISFLVGENGAGKTQLLRLIHGLVVADSGSLNTPPRQYQGYLQQTPRLLNRRVKDNLYYLRGSEVCPNKHFDTVIDDVIAHFELSHLLDLGVHHLSGGQRKRVAIARLFLQQSDCYLLDEPSAHLDHQQNLLLENKIGQVLAMGKKVIMSSHDFFQIERLFSPHRDEIWILKDGKVLEKQTQLEIERLKKYV